MPRIKHNNKLKSGLAPGTAVFTGHRKMDKVDISVMQYSESSFSELNYSSIEKLIPELKNKDNVIWVNITGLHDESAIEEICLHLGVHKLTIEDILNVGQRPKLEEHKDYLHIVIKMLMTGKNSDILDVEQLSFILKDNILITFQEKTGDVFDPVRRRIRDAKGFIRRKKADYLQYVLLDSVVDYYFIILEEFGEKLEAIENSLVKQHKKNDLTKLHIIRHETLELRRAVYPLRELVNSLSNLDDSIVSQETKVYIRDLYDHSIQVIETVEMFRENASGLLDLFMDIASNKMNEIIKVLTIISTIFMPLTFIVGVYGMNFHNMPEINSKYGYLAVWIVMVAIFVSLIIFFKKKKWL